MKIYVCGGSSELEAVAERMRQLRELGHIITQDWVATVRASGESNPRTATHRQRLGWSGADIKGITDADIVWAMLPVKTSFGCALEIGYALGNGKPVIVSGDWRTSIFTSQADARFNEHDHAFEWLRLYGTPGSWDEEMSALEAT
jgi:nucleoside 2-deoxyribosyltransferase